MADDNELDLAPDRDDKRIQTLSTKVKEASQERDTANAAKDVAEAGRVAAEKERDFFASFTDVVTKYPASSEFKDQIKEKVMAGYTTEDATVAVLNAQGRLAPSAPATTPPAPAAGGSAPNIITDTGAKSAQEMTQTERRAALLDAEKQGFISLS